MAEEELDHWIAYSRLCPFGPERENLHAAIIATAIYRSQNPKNQVCPEQFMFKDSISAREAQTSSFLNALNALAVKRDGK